MSAKEFQKKQGKGDKGVASGCPPNACPPLVKITNLSFSYSGKPVLEDVNLEVQQGDFIAFIGPNGGGKTTLIKLILGLLKPSCGEIKIGGKMPGEIKGMLSYVPQYIDHNQNFPATALDVVCMGLFYPGRRSFFQGRKAKREAGLAALDQLALADIASRRIGELSGGQRQRVLIARALVAEPELLILDEPTASLDTRAQTEFFKLLQNLNATRTIIVVSHDLLVISSYAKSIACINRSLHYHPQIGSTGEVMEAFYSTMRKGADCAVERLERLPVLQQEISHA